MPDDATVGGPASAFAIPDAVFENVARHGGGSAHVRPHRDGAAVVIVVIDVSDRGPGLAPDLHGRAFDRFFRADPSRAAQRAARASAFR
jgi:K+-sensing histidine kinase KdpD